MQTFYLPFQLARDQVDLNKEMSQLIQARLHVSHTKGTHSWFQLKLPHSGKQI